MSQRPTESPIQVLAARAAPALFVLLWSTGFIGTKYVLNGAEPFTYLALRMAAAVAILAVVALILRPRWPNSIGIVHSAVAGLLVHGFYLAGTSIAIAHSIPAGLSALLPGLQPILTSTLANRWLGEKVRPLQWIGLALGLAGTLMVLHNRSLAGQAGWGWLASAAALVSITLGTLYQKRFCGGIDWRAGNLIQFAAAGLLYLVGAFLFETRTVLWTREFVLSLGWLVVMLSVGSVGLFYWLIRRSAATQVASLFYLVPSTTALMAFVLFDERLDLVAILGMAICAAAVLLVNKAAARPA